uniref:hypothetical protein n=1 Tax=Marinobacterium profundum TaxID=1714300 RepID=UPI000AB9C97E|nr:hypothetical protein [Marinobacterium profundum]
MMLLFGCSVSDNKKRIKTEQIFLRSTFGSAKSVIESGWQAGTKKGSAWRHSPFLQDD